MRKFQLLDDKTKNIVFERELMADEFPNGMDLIILDNSRHFIYQDTFYGRDKPSGDEPDELQSYLEVNPDKLLKIARLTEETKAATKQSVQPAAQPAAKPAAKPQPQPQPQPQPLQSMQPERPPTATTKAEPTSDQVDVSVKPELETNSIPRPGERGPHTDA